ncbi:KEOPS complex subunit Cgi121 [Haloplanus natans]|uniref:KEOPS complex subunit Cgi121 n=1 Tax=Haloplanus natans TaxID=376171 RepID=UPI000677A338|nr:KEOPS complex subunit Cgi121 [Haloplanus natans]
MRVVEGVAGIADLDAFLDRIDDIAADHGVTVQAFDARYVVGRNHLERAVELADRAFDRGENVARERGVEILLYAAGRRQIDDALAMGVSEGRTPVAVVVSDTAGDEAAEAAAADAVADLLDPAATLDTVDVDRVRAFFDVTEAELGVVDGDLADLVAERVALLDVEK